MVGARGFEPPTTCTPCKYATRLRYAPTKEKIVSVQNITEWGLFSQDLQNNLQLFAQL